MKNIIILIVLGLFFTKKEILAQTPLTSHTNIKQVDVFGILDQMKPEKYEITPLTIRNSAQKISPKEFNISQQIKFLKDQCPSIQQRKASLILNGERLDESMVNLDWKRKNGYDDRIYLVQRSVNDTNHFETVSTVWANAQFRSREEYKHDDANNHAGTSYYRLKLADIQNQFTYSNIVEVKGYAKEKMRVYPNPAKFDTRLHLDTDMEGPSTLQVLDVNGRLLKQEQFFLFTGRNTRTINTGKLVQGAYIIKIIKADKSAVTGRFNKIN